VNSIARLRTRDCAEKRLDELAGILDLASAKGGLPPVGEFGSPPRRLWASGVWNGVVASQTATHFPGQELAVLATAYQLVESRQRISGRRGLRLGSVEHHGGAGPPAGCRLGSRSAQGDKSGSLSKPHACGDCVCVIYRANALALPFSKSDRDAITAIQSQTLTSDKVSPWCLGPSSWSAGHLALCPLNTATRPCPPI
jgi:hypothetical protein